MKLFLSLLLSLPALTWAQTTDCEDLDMDGVCDFCTTFELEILDVEFTWTDPVGGDLVDNVGDTIMWGFPNPIIGKKSGLRAYSEDGLFPKTLVPGMQESFGSLKHFNFPISDMTAVSSVKLVVFIQTNVGDFTFFYDMVVDETLNRLDGDVTKCEYPSDIVCADRIYIATMPGEQSFTVGDVEFELNLLGFRITPDSPTINEFISQEEKMNRADSFMVSLRLTDCPEGGGGVGDPHFQKWNGNWYDFHGACDLHLLNAPSFAPGIPMVIDVRTRTRNWYSYIESTAIKIGDDILEVSSFGEYFLNGVEGAKMPNKLSGYDVTYASPQKHIRVLEIAIDGKEKIVIRSFKDMVSVKVENGDNTRFKGSSGMMGDASTGQVYARDNKTILEDPIAIAREWQVRDDEPMLFQVVQEPQYPQACIMPEKQESAGDLELAAVGAM